MNKFMKIAIQEAEKGILNNDGGPFGCVVVKDGKVVSKGHNCVVKNNDPTCHGEIDAIRKACKKLQTFDLSGCEIYTTGEPCTMCACAVLWANIKKVWFGASIKDNSLIGFRDEKFSKIFKMTPQKDFYEQIDQKECLALFEKYNNLKNKTHY